MAKDAIGVSIRKVSANLVAVQARWAKAMQQLRGEQLAARSLARLQTVPGKPNYPIAWTSDRQRRAFFASRGFGRGIPASRSNPPEVLMAWDADFVPTSEGGILALTNSSDHMEFVQGARAQGLHIDTGYVQVADVTEEALREMEGVAIVEWFNESDPLEGV